jgi:hypothetical protein
VFEMDRIAEVLGGTVVCVLHGFWFPKRTLSPS